VNAGRRCTLVAGVALALAACGGSADERTDDSTTLETIGAAEGVGMPNPITVSNQTLVSEAAYVVVATTTNIAEQDDGSRLVTIRVDRALKGNLTGEVVVIVPADRKMFDDPEGIWFLDGAQPHNLLEDPFLAVPRWIEEEPSILRALDS
jgi:hypothetical protein